MSELTMWERDKLITIDFLNKIKRKEIASKYNLSVARINQIAMRKLWRLRNKYSPDYWIDLNDFIRDKDVWIARIKES